MLLIRKSVYLTAAMILMMIISSCSVIQFKNPFQLKNPFQQRHIPEATDVIPEAESPDQPVKPLPTQPIVVRPTSTEIEVIGRKVFKNETGGRRDKLVHWNANEDFAAMGIAHFTWYPAGRKKTHGNTFPDVIRYLDSHGAPPPPWLQIAINRGAPWYSKQDLDRVRNSPQIQHLINYLDSTRALQTSFIVERAKGALQKVVNLASPNKKQQVANNINVLAATEGGWYPLIDYINFKGEGFRLKPEYNNTSWGMKQVLEQMRPSQPGPQALNAFSEAAYAVLSQRVQNAPAGSKDYTKLAGWKRRVETYRYF